jgi:hypothetical protein
VLVSSSASFHPATSMQRRIIKASVAGEERGLFRKRAKRGLTCLRCKQLKMRCDLSRPCCR